jgi:wobble nucleotide-excising tRNase
LAKAGEEENYKIVRTDGSDAKESLSEGEKTFITFLYFYHLLKGSNSNNGTVTDRVVVIDDPVSSLDSDILFIVSSLIKILCQEVRDKKTSVKQVFVLTHNVYFHKEVTFNSKRRGGKMKEETFWTVRKSGELTRIVCHLENPITSQYDLLWADVRRGDRDNHSIQNTLRKILENYFKFFGGVNPEDIITRFEGADLLTCRSLLSWVNDGSHFAQDDLYHAIDDAMVDRYLQVFHLVFEKTGHTAHYDMMMRIGEDANAV